MAINFTSGQVLTASALNALAPLYVLKTVNQTITSSTVQTNDSALFVALPANQTWEVKAIIIAGTSTGATGGGITTTWSLSSTGTLVTRHTIGPADAATVTGPDLFMVQGRGLFTLTTNPAYLLNTPGASFPYRIEETLIVSAGASGTTCQFLWAQTSSNAIGTTVYANSYIIARAIA
jgi:hypothetical protein